MQQRFLVDVAGGGGSWFEAAIVDMGGLGG